MFKYVLIPVLALASLVSASVAGQHWSLDITEPKYMTDWIIGKNYTVKWTINDPKNILPKDTIARLSYSEYSEYDPISGYLAKDFLLSKGSIVVTAPEVPWSTYMILLEVISSQNIGTTTYVVIGPQP
ncbi:hypothetical protein BDF14DRAFT_1768899 [Spinellus fusiger]|nr:hypothetical protein BDF14DRAFT_1768899 [Spinellus fusiger]